MTIHLDADLPTKPLLAAGRATADGVAVAERYREVKDLIDVLEKEKAVLREAILDAAAEYPDTKSFPAGDLVIRITNQTRETVPVAEIRKNHRDLYDLLKDEGVVNTSVAKVLSVR